MVVTLAAAGTKLLESHSNKLIEVEVFSPVYSATEIALDNESDLRRLFDYLAGVQSGTASFGPPPIPSDNADVILGVSGASYTVTSRREDNYYQLIGDANAKGEVELNLGGQPSPIPRKMVTLWNRDSSGWALISWRVGA